MNRSRALPPSRREATPALKTLRHLVHDRPIWLLGGLWLTLFLAASSWLPGPLSGPHFALGLQIALLGLAVWTFLVPARADEPDERRFWIDLGWGLATVVAAQLVRATPTPNPAVSTLLGDLLYTAFFVLWVLALQRRPHATPSTWSDTPTPWLHRITGLVLVVGIFAYLNLTPLWVGAEVPRDLSLSQDIPASLALHLVLDLYLVALLLYRTATCQVFRWRRLYGLLTLALSFLVLGDLLQTLRWDRLADSTMPLLDEPLHSLLAALPAVLLVITGRWRVFERADRSTSGDESPFASQVAPMVHTLALALTLPVLHAFYHQLRPSEETLERVHEIFVLTWMILLGALAALLHRAVRRQLMAVGRERQQLETTLESGRSDVRLMVEQRQSHDAVEASDESFAQALRYCPEAISLTALDTGHHLRVNQRYADLIGFSQEDIVGKTSQELGLWAAPWQRARLLQELDRQGAVRDMPLTLRNHSGELRDLLVSARRLSLEDKSLLLSVAVDITGQRRVAEALRRTTDRFDQLAGVVLGVDTDLRILYWSAGASALTGLDPEAVSFHSLGVLLPGGQAPVVQLRRHCALERPWRGPLTLEGRDQRTITLDARWLPVRIEGELVSWLLVAPQPTPAANPNWAPTKG